MSNELARIDTRGSIVNKNTFIAYDDRLVINYEGIEDTVINGHIQNICVAEDYSHYKERTVVIDTAPGELEFRWELPDRHFDNRLSPLVSTLLEGPLSFVKKNKQMTPSRAWVNTACAISFILDRRDLGTFGGLTLGETYRDIQRDALELNWGITSPARARHMVESLINCRANSQYQQVLQAERGPDSRYGEKTLRLVEEIDRKFGTKGIVAWDYARAILVAASAYVAHYLDADEASEMGLRAALKMQESFSGWQEMNENYLAGFAFWFGEAGEERRLMYERKQEIYARLLASEASPFKKIPWDRTLEKDW